jgi:TctA family transporter
MKRYALVYDSVLTAAFLAILINYFLLMVKQVEGFVSPHPAIALCSVLFLLLLTVLMRKYDLGDKLLAYGIISIVGYIAFLFWAYITSPPGPREIQPLQPEYP